jgi:hypothetical protein
MATLVSLFENGDEAKQFFELMHKFFQQIVSNDYAHFVISPDWHPNPDRFSMPVFRLKMKAVNLNVLIPLNRLIKYFDLPNKLIEKRFNKLLDYDKVRVEVEKTKANDQNKNACKYFQSAFRLDLMFLELDVS